MRQHLRLFRTALISVTLSLFSLACSAQAQKLEPLRMVYSSNTPGSDSTFLFAGKQLGFFKDEGIDLQIDLAAGNTAAMAVLAAGRADVSIGGPEPIVNYASKGVGMKSIYVYAHQTIWGLGFLKSSKIQKITDLKGARVGVLSLGSGAVPALQYSLREAGMKLDDVKMVPIGTGASAVVAVKSGEVDALMFYDTAWPMFAQNGIEVNLYEIPKLQTNYPGNVFVARDDTIQEKRALIQRFVRAAHKSLIYSTRNPTGATKAFSQEYPEVIKNLPLEEVIWKQRAKILVLPESAKGVWGSSNDAGWEKAVDMMFLAGLITTKPAVSKLYTNEFLKEANAMDLSKLPK